MNDESPKGFTVKDRRHFTADGDARPERPEPPAPEPSHPAPGRVEGTPEVAAGREDAGHEEGDHEDLELPLVPTDLAGLIASLATQGAYMLSAPVPPQGLAVLLESAKSVITLLEVLRDKTEGHRTAEEQAILDDVLYQLRMGFVARSREGRA